MLRRMLDVKMLRETADMYEGYLMIGKRVLSETIEEWESSKHDERDRLSRPGVHLRPCPCRSGASLIRGRSGRRRVRMRMRVLRRRGGETQRGDGFGLFWTGAWACSLRGTGGGRSWG